MRVHHLIFTGVDCFVQYFILVYMKKTAGFGPEVIFIQETIIFCQQAPIVVVWRCMAIYFIYESKTFPPRTSSLRSKSLILCISGILCFFRLRLACNSKSSYFPNNQYHCIRRCDKLRTTYEPRSLTSSSSRFLHGTSACSGVI